MRRFFFTASALVAAVALSGCAEQQAQRQLNAASSDLDSDIFTDADGYASTTGDGPFPDPFVPMFEVTLADGADLVEAGAQLNMLIEDHEMSADILIEEGKELRTERHWREASVLADDEWAEVLGLVIEEDLTRATLFDVNDAGETHLTLRYDSEDYQEASDALLSWQQLETPAGVSAMNGALEAGGPGTDTFMQVPYIQLHAPLGQGEALDQIVRDAVEHPHWHEVRELDLSKGDGGARLEMQIYLDDEPRNQEGYLEFLAENPESYRVAEDFADHVEETLDLHDQMDTRIYTASPAIGLVNRGSFADERPPEEINIERLESAHNE